MDTDMLPYFRRMFDYDAWANSRAYSSIREQGDAGPEARRLFSHILAAESIWLARLVKDQPTIGPWTEMTLEQCGRYVRDLPQFWTTFVGELTENDLDEGVTYTNTKGEAFETKVRDILQHVLAHSAYHRGQIAQRVREVGLTPAVTDYIAFDRARGV